MSYKLPQGTRDSIMACQRNAEWAGEGSFAVSVKSCKAAIELLSYGLPIPDAIGPSVHGGIGLSWYGGDFSIVYVEVYTPTRILFSVESQKHDPADGHIGSLVVESLLNYMK